MILNELSEIKIVNNFLDKKDLIKLNLIINDLKKYKLNLDAIEYFDEKKNS